MTPYKDGPSTCPKCGAPTHYTASGDTESQGYFGTHRYAPPQQSRPVEATAPDSMKICMRCGRPAGFEWFNDADDFVSDCCGWGAVDPTREPE